MWAASWRGSSGRNDVGALYVRTGEEGSVAGEDFAVLRAQTPHVPPVLRRRPVHRPPRPRHRTPATRHTMGADFLLATSTFRGSENLNVGGFFVDTTRTPMAITRYRANHAFGLQVDYPNDPWSSSFLYREIQADYNAAVGFTPRTGFRRMTTGLSYTARPRRPSMDSQRSVRRRRQLPARYAKATACSIATWISRCSTSPRTRRTRSTCTCCRPTNGWSATSRSARASRCRWGSEYRFTRYRFSASTAQRRVVAVGPTFEVGSFYNGTRRRTAIDLNVRVRPGVIIYTSAEWNSVELAEGRFDTRLYRIVPELQFSPGSPG